MRALIIEDEPVAADALRSLVGELYPHIGIEAVLQSVEESVEWLSANPMPELIFSDIHLADGSSFGIFEEVEVTCPIIFTTAYDEYALRAFEVNSIDYLLKPIGRAELQRAIGKLPSRGEARTTPENLRQLGRDITGMNRPYRSSFLIAERDKLIPLPIKEIAYIFIDSRVVTAVTYDERNRNLEQTLDELMAQLDPNDFFRANRQYIIARAAVKDISMWFGGKLAINLSVPAPERINVSKARVREFKNWITG